MNPMAHVVWRNGLINATAVSELFKANARQATKVSESVVAGAKMSHVTPRKRRDVAR